MTSAAVKQHLADGIKAVTPSDVPNSREFGKGFRHEKQMTPSVFSSSRGFNLWGIAGSQARKGHGRWLEDVEIAIDYQTYADAFYLDGIIHDDAKAIIDGLEAVRCSPGSSGLVNIQPAGDERFAYSVADFDTEGGEGRRVLIQITIERTEHV